MKKLFQAKKAMFFTLIAILIVGLLVLTFSTKIDIKIKGHLPVLERRITAVNTFVHDIENTYLERMLRISILSAFNALRKEQGTFRDFLTRDEFEAVFAELAINGTLDVDGEKKKILEDYNLNSMLKELARISKDELHVKSIFEPLSLNVFQNNETGPWNIGINFTINYFVDGDLAAWNRSSNIITQFSIIGLEDPLYHYSSNQDLLEDVHKNIITADNFNDNWTIENFALHVKGQTYRYDPKAPSYLLRLINDYNASSCCGIESMINLNNMVAEDNKNATFVDYCYWSDICIGEDYGNYIWTIEGDKFGKQNITYYGEERDALPEHEFYRFKLDTYHIGRYNLTEYTADLCKYDFTLQQWNGTGCV
ncbi:hypothetical protein J4206_04800 [Candidatus Woesearchaeota archaeon]|nr:hypothetical protein [Candidatus Woesearchaeota archaeon]